jgi:hypothetical protein
MRFMKIVLTTAIPLVFLVFSKLVTADSGLLGLDSLLELDEVLDLDVLELDDVLDLDVLDLDDALDLDGVLNGDLDIENFLNNGELSDLL